MVAVSRTARKVIHQHDESGSSPYERARREADELGLLRMSTAEQPGSDIGARSDAEVGAMRQQWLDIMHPPAGWGADRATAAQRLAPRWRGWRRPHGRSAHTDAIDAPIAA